MEAEESNEEKKRRYLYNKRAVRKIIGALDIWRGIIYGVVLEEIFRENFQYLGVIAQHCTNYIILLSAVILTISEPIIRYLYMDLVIREIEDHNYAEELTLVFIAFCLEIGALFCLCFGIQGLNNLSHWHYLVFYFFFNWLLNLLELYNIYKKRKTESPNDPTVTKWGTLIKAVKGGELENFLLGKCLTKEFTRFSRYSEQFITYNTFFVGLFLTGFLVTKWTNPFFTANFIIERSQYYVFWSSLLATLILPLQKNRITLLNMILLVSYLSVFLSGLGISNNNNNLAFFVISCFLHYLLIAFFYLRLYVLEIFPKLYCVGKMKVNKV